MTRGRLRTAAAVLAVAILGVLAWLLWPGAPGVQTDAVSTPAAPGKRVSSDDTIGPLSPTGHLTSTAPAGKGTSAAEPDAAGSANSFRFRYLRGACVLEDGSPLPGATLTGVYFAQGSPRLQQPQRSGIDGNFEVAWIVEPVMEQRLRVGHAHADLVSAEGAEMLKDVDESNDGEWNLEVKADPLRLVFRDRAGTAHVRLVNAETNAPVTSVAGLRVAYLFRAGSLSYGVPEDPGLGGWIPILEGRLPEVGPDPEGKDRDLARLAIDLEKVEVEFAVPGFEKGRLPLRDIRGRIELRVRPVPADATGEVVDMIWGVEVATPPVISEDAFQSVTPRLRWNGTGASPSTAEVLGLPTRAGNFALYNLPDGAWYLEVAATTHDNRVIRGGKAFERRGSPVDIGRIELRESGIVTLHVVDSSGAAIPQAWAVVVRPEESPDQGRRIDLNDGAMASVGDLEPGIAHRVIVRGLPRELEQTATAEAKPKTTLFQWPEKLVPCRITLIVDGKAVANADGRRTIPAVVQESPLPRDKGAWGDDGTFEAKLVPGTYRFSALATPKEGGDMALFAGEVTVPAGDAFETRLELRREGK